jgi:hypothetical protein
MRNNLWFHKFEQVTAIAAAAAAAWLGIEVGG